MDSNKSNLLKMIAVFAGFFILFYSSTYDFLNYVLGYLLVFGLPMLIIGWVYTRYYLKKNQFQLIYIFRYFQPLSKQRIQILNDKFLYYTKLSNTDKAIFEKHVNHFLINKRFVSEDYVEITEEMKVLIAATAIQILFGRDGFYLAEFSSIRIVDSEDVDVKRIKIYHQLEIPWKAFAQGYESMVDGYNPGIKIMALALSLEKQLSEGSIFNFSSNTAFNKLYKSQAEKYIASGKSKYKTYDQVDRNEYFSVAVEYFFERPEHFYVNQPAMYMALSKLLKQDPLGNYIYNKKKK